MSNPFGDDNPFGANPFASQSSPSVTSSGNDGGYVPPSASSSDGAKAGYDITSGASEDPFKPAEKAPSPPPPAAAAPSPPPTVTAFNDPPPLATSSAVFQDDGGELARREAELARREEALHAKTAQFIKNWPPCYPVATNYISTEIPQPHRWTVRLAYYCFLFNLVALFWNFIVELIFYFGVEPFLAALYLAIAGPFGWLWYKQLYNGLKNDRSRNFVCFFIGIGMHWAFICINLVGIPDWGMAGIIVMLKSTKHSTAHWAMTFTSACMFGFDLLFSTWVLRKAHYEYRHKGVQGFYEIRDDAAQAAVSHAADAAWQNAQRK